MMSLNEIKWKELRKNYHNLASLIKTEGKAVVYSKHYTWVCRPSDNFLVYDSLYNIYSVIDKVSPILIAGPEGNTSVLQLEYFISNYETELGSGFNIITANLVGNSDEGLFWQKVKFNPKDEQKFYAVKVIADIDSCKDSVLMSNYGKRTLNTLLRDKKEFLVVVDINKIENPFDIEEGVFKVYLEKDFEARYQEIPKSNKDLREFKKPEIFFIKGNYRKEVV